jgi:hypothetical protein
VACPLKGRLRTSEEAETLASQASPRLLVAYEYGGGRIRYRMAKELSHTKNAIYLRERYAEAKAAKGPKPLFAPSQDESWIEHHAYPDYYGRPDGKVWSAKTGTVLEGHVKADGYNRVGIDGKQVKRSRFNLSLSLGRAIKEGFDCDHIVPIDKGGGDAWANLQELSRPDHNRKTALDNPDAGKKMGITQGFPIIARHAGTGDETRFDSMTKAIQVLRVSHRVVTTSLNGETIRSDYVFSYTPEHLAEQADLPGERWLPAVSSWGLLPNIKASDRGRIQDCSGRRSYGTDSDGYKSFGTMIDEKKRNLQVHNVIGRTFLEAPPSPEHTPDHINGDRSDNRVENLRWATVTEQGRNQKSNRRLVQLDPITGEQLTIFGTLTAAAEAVGVTPCAIRHHAANGRTSRPVVLGGFLLRSLMSLEIYKRRSTIFVW